MSTTETFEREEWREEETLEDYLKQDDDQLWGARMDLIDDWDPALPITLRAVLNIVFGDLYYLLRNDDDIKNVDIITKAIEVIADDIADEIEAEPLNYYLNKVAGSAMFYRISRHQYKKLWGK